MSLSLHRLTWVCCVVKDLQRRTANSRDAVTASQQSAIDISTLTEQVTTLRQQLQQQRSDNDRLNKV